MTKCFSICLSFIVVGEQLEQLIAQMNKLCWLIYLFLLTETNKFSVFLLSETSNFSDLKAMK